MGEPTSCCRSDGGYCDRCDLLLGLEGLRVVAVDRDDGGALTVTVESAPGVMGCRACGVVALGHGRLDVHLVDAPAMGRLVRICWRKRRWLCPEPACPVTTFVEQDERVAAPRAKLTTRACRWAINQLRREHASVNGLRRQLGTGWRTVWESIRPLLATPARPVISMTSLTREALMLWVAAMERRCERALRPGCTALASSRAPTSRSGARCCR
jgi:hypothetical protein